MRFLIALIFFITLVVEGGCVTPQPGTGERGNLEAIQFDTLALDLGEWDQAINTLTDQLHRHPGSAQLHYNLGLAYYQMTMDSRGELSKPVLLGILSSDEVAWFSEALERFKSAADLDMSGSVADKALYLAGQCLDIGRLQRFEEAMEFYQICSERFPETDAGWRCLERYDLLKDRFKGVDGGSHGMGK